MRTQRALILDRNRTHAERDAYCKDTFWYEPGARNARNEFVRWLHIRNDTTTEGHVVPWPFETNQIDPSALLAHWHMHRFENWPGEWFNLRVMIDQLHRSARIGKRVLWWGLGRGPHYISTAQFPVSQVPKEFIDALTRPDKASR